MKKSRDPQFRRDLLKLGCLVAVALGTVGVFIVTPTLSSPTLLAMVTTTLLSPWVAGMERRGYSRASAICLIFLILIASLFLFGFWGVQSGLSEWNSFKEHAPEHFKTALNRMMELETSLKARYSFLQSIHPTEQFLNLGKETGGWFVDHGPALMGAILSWTFIIPPLTFVLLNEGPAIRRGFFQLVPNRYFEAFFLISTQITHAISDYIRAKLLEAVLVGTLVTIGLALIHAPYAIVLGIVAGITNIIPYLGPFLGAAPGVLLAYIDSAHPGILLPVGLVYLVANLIDTVVIFPLVVARLVKLHPLILIAVVIVGQHYYGLVGMLISVPVASALKVVFQEVYVAVYEQRSTDYSSELSETEPLLTRRL